MHFLQIAINNLTKQFSHFLISNLDNSFFENSFFELFIINIGEKFGLVSCVIPIGLLLDVFSYIPDNLLESFRVTVVTEYLSKYFGLSWATMLHLR